MSYRNKKLQNGDVVLVRWQIIFIVFVIHVLIAGIVWSLNVINHAVEICVFWEIVFGTIDLLTYNLIGSPSWLFDSNLKSAIWYIITGTVEWSLICHIFLWICRIFRKVLPRTSMGSDEKAVK